MKYKDDIVLAHNKTKIYLFVLLKYSTLSICNKNFNYRYISADIDYQATLNNRILLYAKKR